MTTVVMNLRSRLLALPNKLAANIAKLDGDEGKIMDLLQSSSMRSWRNFLIIRWRCSRQRMMKKMNKTEKKPDKPGGACKHCPWGKRIHQRLILCMFPACVRGEPKREEKTERET